MQIRLPKWLKNPFKPLKTEDISPEWNYGLTMGSTTSTVMEAMGLIPPTPEELQAQHQRNMESIELAKLKHQKDVADKTLLSQHRVMLVTIAATLIALFSAVSAIFIALQKETPPAPIVNVAPSQQAAPPEVKVYVTPQQENPQQ